MKSNSLVCTTFSKNLEKAGSIIRYGSVVRIGIILAILLLSGVIPVLIEQFIIRSRGYEISEMTCLMLNIEISSKPLA